MRFYDMVNADEIEMELMEMLKRFDIEMNSYQTDLYIDENGKGRLHEFTNIGGNAWLNDDHIFLYADKPCHDTGEFTEEEYIETIENGAFDEFYQDTVYMIIDEFNEVQRYLERCAE